MEVSDQRKSGIVLRRIEQVCLRVDDVAEAAPRWAIQFGLTETRRAGGRAYLACGYEPYSLELVSGDRPGHDHTGFELARGVSLDAAAGRLDALGVRFRAEAGALHLADPDGNGIELLPYRPDADPFPPVTRRTDVLPGFHPRKLGHVNFLTADVATAGEFHTDVLGMRLTDRLGDEGAWYHVNADHHVMALVGKGYAHFHHF